MTKWARREPWLWTVVSPHVKNLRWPFLLTNTNYRSCTGLILKLHKTSYKARFISSATQTTTTSISKYIITCLTEIKVRVLHYWAPSKGATGTIFKVFGMTRPGIEPGTSRTRSGRSTDWAIGAVALDRWYRCRRSAPSVRHLLVWWLVITFLQPFDT